MKRFLLLAALGLTLTSCDSALISSHSGEYTPSSKKTFADLNSEQSLLAVCPQPPAAAWGKVHKTKKFTKEDADEFIRIVKEQVTITLTTFDEKTDELWLVANFDTMNAYFVANTAQGCVLASTPITIHPES